MASADSPKAAAATHQAFAASGYLGVFKPVLAMPDLPCPKKAKAFPVPSDHGFGLDDDECGAPVSPHSAQPSPEQPVEGCQPGLLHRTMQNAELVPERKVLQLESGSGLED